jgi:organic radical activating enzyme
MTTYQVNEIFHSIQGEGYHMGSPATFIRLQGCTVGCHWCDTKYTWKKGGQKMSVEKIVSKVKTHHVVITGGEPIMYNLDPLLKALRDPKWHFTQLETSGQQWLKGERHPSWITWSPKENLRWSASTDIWQHCHEIKYVIDENFTWDVIESAFKELASVRQWDPPQIYLMPEGCPPRPEMIGKTLELIEWGRKVGWVLCYSDRLQYRIGVK